MSRDIIKRIALVAAAGAGIIAYICFTPPAAGKSTLIPAGFATRLTGSALYAQRFAASFLFLGGLPIAAALASGFSPRKLGLRIPKWRRWPVIFLALFAAGIVAGWISSVSDAVAEFYPYDPLLADRVAERGAGPYFTHIAAYVILYYLPWELLFRGVLIIPFLDENVSDAQAIPIACLQAIPSAMLHYGHPASEIVSALFFGLAAGYVVVKTRSILPALIFHAAAGIGLDAALVFFRR